ncbi:outer membrane protein assembly factor BamE domain-containing protein [Parvibium lacunae]|uniref:Outer membrane protein assembly factor BamE n=1 Tax=Parvibium lacunae TaxID=1888893 RepID=A0A368L445_9BURK|nr:outer membrane protein assembly factor BamE [Parvibium lacunae]RCS58351.1 outer membrane protein assembly factor BamE [Parvibium lacunae]
MNLSSFAFFRPRCLGSTALPAAPVTEQSLVRRCAQTIMYSLGGLLMLAVGGCSTVDQYVPRFMKTYRIDVQQGNMISQEMVAQLKLGMTPDQVRFILGTPLVTDPFRPNRWEYVFRLQRGTGQVELRNFAVVFENDRLTRFGGDTQPTENKGQQTIVTVGRTPQDVKVEKLQNALDPLATDPANAEQADTRPKPSIPAYADVSARPPANAPVTAASESVPESPPLPSSQASQVITTTTGNAQQPLALVLDAADERALRETLEAWRQAWINRLPGPYLSFYSPSYQVGNMSRAEWERGRRERLTRASRVNVTISQLTLQLLSQQPDKQAKLVFQQTYESDLQRERGTKTLLMRKASGPEGRWLIEFEQFTPQ